MKILVPIDFSTCAINALAYAIRVGKDMKAELILFHAYHPLLDKNGSAYKDEQMIQQEEQEAKTKMRKLAASMPELYQVSHRYLMKNTLAADGIVEAVHTHQVDLLIMGTKGAHDMYNALLGSTTYTVIQKATCPVIAVPENYNDFQLKNIMLATDFHAIQDKTIWVFLTSFIRAFKATLQFLHVHADATALDDAKSVEALALEDIFQGIPHTYHFLKEKEVEKGIQHHLQTHPTDLLVVIPKKHNLFERLFKDSVTKHMALHSQIPLLALHH